MVRRMSEWHDSLAEVGVRMHISVDVTHGSEAADLISDAIPGAALHTYDEGTMLYSFPHLGRLKMMLPGESGWAGLRCLTDGTQSEDVQTAFRGGWRRWAGERPSIAWGMHAEAITLWWRAIIVRWADGGDPKPDHVWVLEDDVGFTAPLAELVAAYAHEPEADLITDAPTLAEPVSAVHCKPRPDGQPGAEVKWDVWCWHGTCTDAYAALVPPSRRYQTKEHAQRFSGRLLEELARQCEAGCSAWSEQFAVSLCLLSRSLHCVALEPKHLPPDPISQYSHKAKVSETEYRELCANPDTRRVLVHALKW